MAEHELPSNSHTNRPKPPAKEEVKKVEQVTTGKVIKRKVPLGTRLRETFVGGDAKSVGGYVLFEVLVPALKDTIADIVSQGAERMLFGDVRSSSRRTGFRTGNPTGHVSYNRYSSSAPWSRNRPEESRPRPTTRTRGSHDFDQIILATRGEAEEVIDRLFDLIAKYEQATVNDLYELVGISGSFTDERWGWTDIRGAGVSRISNGYLLDLPRPEPLD